MDLSSMDIVYPYLPWNDNGIELKYSLRSLQNIPHRNVILIGTPPQRLNTKEVRVINFLDDPNHSKYRNVTDKRIIISNDESISDDYIRMNDDMFIMKPITNIPYYTKCSLREHLNLIAEKFGGVSKYYKVIERVYKVFPNGMSFEVHCPMVFNKDKSKKLLDDFWPLELAFRSMYCNLFWVEWTPFINDSGSIDCKSYNGRLQEIDNLNNLTYLSTYDELKYEYKKRLDSKLWTKSIYEL